MCKMQTQKVAMKNTQEGRITKNEQTTPKPN